MRKFLPYILSLAALFLSIAASAQSYTSFSKTVISFDSTPEGAKVYYKGECIGTTPCSVEVKEDYILHCDREDSLSMSQKDIKAYNSAQMDTEMRLSGKESGTFSKFAMTFEFVIDGRPHASKTVPLMWAPAKVMGMDGTKIYYPDKVFCNL